MAGTQTKDDAAVRDQATVHHTRQLLDELDALMDQMLALPIDDANDAAIATASAPPATISATLTLVEPAAAPGAAERPVDSARVVRPARFDVEPDSSPPTTGESVTASPVLSPPPLLADVASPESANLLPLPPHIPTARWRPDHISYQFLLWVNQRYDHGTTWLGKPGRFLRSTGGKLMLGVSGLALLSMALTWLAKDWLGWNW